MATKESTLQLKDFRGINRFADGTVTPPNEFWSLQNYHPLSRGELESLKGVVNSGFTFPGVALILHSQFLNPTNGDKKLITFYEPNFDSWPALPAITATNLSTSGGGAQNQDLRFTYVGPGGAYYSVTVMTYPVQLNGVSFVLPLGIPDYVACIDIHGKDSATGVSYIWMGTVSRRDGIFPSAATLPNPAFAVETNAGLANEAVPNFFRAIPALGGNLVAGRTYYFAIAPWKTQSTSDPTVARLTRPYLSMDAGVSFFTATLPAEFGSFNVRFDWSTSPTPNGGTGNDVIRWVLFIGTTPEDMIAVGSRTDGTVTAVLDADVRSPGINVKEIPTNSRNAVHMISSDRTNEGGSGQDAASVRDYGAFKNIQTDADRSFVNSYKIGAWVFPSLTDFTKAYQLLPHENEYGFVKTSTTGTAEVPRPTLFQRIDKAQTVYTQQYANRLYCVNNENAMFYTNGYVFKKVVRDDGVYYIPITKYIGLVKDQIALGGGDNNFANTNSGFFHSEIANPNAFGVAAPDWNFLSVNSGDDSGINGFGTYSADLSASGPRTFLVISKDDSTFSWNGIGGTSAEIAEMDQVGFAGPNAFARTNFGPVFIGRESAYLVLGNRDLQPVGDELRPILTSLTPAQLAAINVCYHQGKLKVGYTDSDMVHKELWLELRQEQGGIQKFWSGPHLLKDFTDQASITSFGTQRDVRVSVLGAALYQRDTGYTNDTANIAHKIIINRLGLEADHFSKLIDWLYLALKISQNETFTFTLDQEDGSAQSVLTGTALFATAARQFLQVSDPERSMGRIRTLTIDNSSNMGHSIFDISILFKVLRRRLLR